MKIIIPEDGQPIKYSEYGEFQKVDPFIYVKSDLPVIQFAIMQPLPYSNLFKWSEDVPTELSIKCAIYEKKEGPNCEGISRYILINYRELGLPKHNYVD